MQKFDEKTKDLASQNIADTNKIIFKWKNKLLTIFYRELLPFFQGLHKNKLLKILFDFFQRLGSLFFYFLGLLTSVFLKLGRFFMALVTFIRKLGKHFWELSLGLLFCYMMMPLLKRVLVWATANPQLRRGHRKSSIDTVTSYCKLFYDIIIKAKFRYLPQI